MADTKQTVLDVRNLAVHFKTYDGLVRAVDGVSYSVPRGRTLGIVGESGSGKTVANLAVMGLISRPPGIIPTGEVLFEEQELMRLSKEQLRRMRGRRIAMIFQDPMTSLNPFLRISTQMTEAMELHLGLSRRQALDRAVDMLEKVGIPAAARRITSYPHQFSGGMRQRVMIAMPWPCPATPRSSSPMNPRPRST